MLLCAQHGLCAVGMVGKQCREHSLGELAAIAGEAHVLLLIYGLQLGMETADDVVLEAVGLNLCPVFQLVGGDILDVAGDIEAGVGVGAVGTDGSHQLVVLIGDGELGCLVGEAVDLAVDGGALCLVGLGAVHLEECLNLVEQGLLLGVVLCAEVLGALEHQVLEVVGKAGSLSGVVLATHTHGDVGLYARSLLIYGEVHLQSIVQCVDTALHGVAVDCLVAALAGT